jgi:5-methylcytosine-specific restriction endonuclease McrA
MPRINNWDNRSEILSLIWALFDKWEKFKGKCEDCGNALAREAAKIHHTKYEGATIYDLQIVCQKCNTATRNRGLH